MKTLAAITVFPMMLSPTFAQQDQSAAAQPSTAGSMGAGGGGGMSEMMGMCMMMHPSIAVDAEAVYVIRGDQVFKLAKDDFRILSTATLPKMDMGGTPGPATGRGPSMTARPEMQQRMQQMRQMQPTQFERTFLEGMIRHHQGAIIMSQVALEKATHTELRRFAQKTIENQSVEQQQFATWLKKWHNVSAAKQPTQMDEQMADHLRALTGREFEIRFMQDMIIHHTEAVQMARDAQQRAPHQEVKAAAGKIVTQQASEISQLQDWLQTWYGIRPTQ